MKAIQEQIRPCNTCGKETLQRRNVTPTGILDFLIHGCMLLITGGLWLGVIVLLILVRSVMAGKWICSECPSPTFQARTDPLATDSDPLREP